MTTDKIRSKRPLTKRKCVKRSDLTGNAPPSPCFGETPRGELAGHLSVRDGAVSEAGKCVLFTDNYLHAWDVGWKYFPRQQRN